MYSIPRFLPAHQLIFEVMAEGFGTIVITRADALVITHVVLLIVKENMLADRQPLVGLERKLQKPNITITNLRLSAFSGLSAFLRIFRSCTLSFHFALIKM